MTGFDKFLELFKDTKLLAPMLLAVIVVGGVGGGLWINNLKSSFSMYKEIQSAKYEALEKRLNSVEEDYRLRYQASADSLAIDLRKKEERQAVDKALATNSHRNYLIELLNLTSTFKNEILSKTLSSDESVVSKVDSINKLASLALSTSLVSELSDSSSFGLELAYAFYDPSQSFDSALSYYQSAVERSIRTSYLATLTENKVFEQYLATFEANTMSLLESKKRSNFFVWGILSFTTLLLVSLTYYLVVSKRNNSKQVVKKEFSQEEKRQ